MDSLSRLHRVVVLAVVGCTLPWAGQMLGAGQVFGQRSGDSQLDAMRLSRNGVSEAPRGLKPAAQDIQDIQEIIGLGSTGTGRSTVARAVTGPTENLSNIIAGGVPATLIFALTPVAEHPDGAYGGGNLSYSAADISGQELTVQAGVTTYWNAQLSNWAPTGLRLRYPQAKIDAQTFSSGAGAPLALPSIPCATHNDCVNAHSEPGIFCASDDICRPAWINKTRTDGLFFDQIEIDCLAAWDVGFAPTGPLFAAITKPNRSKTEFCSEADKGIIYYFGTLALTVPLGAVGTYTIELLDNETFAFDDTTIPGPILIPIGTLAPGVLHVLPPADPWTPGTCTVEPSDVTNLDQATITLGGDWGTDCVPRVSQITIDGNTVYFDVLLDYGPDPICLTVITPWSLSETLDPLAPGTYTIMVTLYGSLNTAPVPTPFCNFTVEQAVWQWQPEGCTVEPVDPTNADQAMITLGGDWPNSCVPNVAQITTDWITVDFDVVVDYSAGPDCLAIITPWSLSATLDPLTPDTYTVMATLYGVPSIPSVPTFVCSFTVKPAYPIAQNRYIGMEVPATESEQTAIEVTLARLHHTCGPGSWNLLAPCDSDAYCRGDVCETPFAGFEGQKRYVNAIRMCRGGTEDGRGICKSQDDCDERGKGGTCEQMYTCQGGTEPGGKACIDQAVCDARMDFLTGVPRGGTCVPSITCEDSETRDTTFACAVLGCQPEYRDWSSELGGRTLYATGPEIMPGASRYEITLLPASCMGNEGSCAEALPLLTVGTPRWGDVEDHVGVSTLDLVHMVDRIKELVGTILKPAAQFQPQQVNPLNPMDVRDLTLSVDAVKFFPYPYKTLTPCE